MSANHVTEVEVSERARKAFCKLFALMDQEEIEHFAYSAEIGHIGPYYRQAGRSLHPYDWLARIRLPLHCQERAAALIEDRVGYEATGTILGWLLSVPQEADSRTCDRLRILAQWAKRYANNMPLARTAA